MDEAVLPSDPEYLDETSSPEPSEDASRLSKPYEKNRADGPPGETPADSSGTHVGLTDNDRADDVLLDPGWLLDKARDIYRTSTDYVETNLTNNWERNLSHFRNQHAGGSAYNRRDWRRSRVFRPKTRSMVKGHEAALANAVFATKELVHITPQDPRVREQHISAEINKNLLQYRLQKRMPWFLTVLGAYQDTNLYGVCISFQYWRYVTDDQYEIAYDEEGNYETDEDTGLPLGTKTQVVREDKLVCDLIAPENFRFDPMCDWRDPANTSPYLVYLMPVYVEEALQRMDNLDSKTGRPVWKKYSADEIRSTTREEYSGVRQAREGEDRIDPADENRGKDYDVVWAHMNIVRIKGEDYLFWTMGTELLLTDPVKLQDAFPHLGYGERPFTVGFSSVEAHRNYPAGDAEQSSGLQEEINSIANQRLDNVKLVLNKRYYVRRGSQVDLDALIRNVPGGGVMMNDPDRDVKTVDTRDVTSSSYEEQNRLAVEMDELTGSFSQGSVQSNRQLNETVGGMNRMTASAGTVQDYSLQVFMNTWMQPTMKQLLKLIQMYETDEVLLAVAAGNSKLWQRFGLDKVTDNLLQQDLTLEIGIGIGNTDPLRRVERLVFGIGQAVNLPGMAERIKATQITDEIFGALGYRDSSRFFMTDEEMEQSQQEQGEEQPPPEIMLKMKELEIRREDNDARNKRELLKQAQELELRYADLALNREMTLTQLFSKLGLEEMKLKEKRDSTALKAMNQTAEMTLKRITGSGI